MIPAQETLDNLTAEDFISNDKIDVNYLVGVENQRVYEVGRGFR